MIRALSSLLALMIASPTSGQSTQVSQFVSPCPDVFTYDTAAIEPHKWNGVVTLTTDTTLYALWLNIVLDNKANILGNWVGEVTTDNNIDFKIENTNLTIKPGSLAIPFFIQYKAGDTPPKLVSIRFNGKEICQVEKPPVVESAEPIRATSYEELRPEVTTKTTVRPVVATTLRNYNKQTTKAQYWYQTEKPQTTTNSLFWTQTTPAPTTATTLPPQYWTRTTSEVKSHTTVRTPVWSYVKGDTNKHVTSTLRPKNQTWTQSRTEVAPRITTEQNSVSKVQSWSQTKDRNGTENFQAQTQVQNNQQSTSVNRYQVQNDIKQQTTVGPIAWPNLPVVQAAGNQNVSPIETRPNNSQIEVKQVGQTKYWSKIPAENSTGSVAKAPSATESTSYGWSENQQRVPDNGLQNQPYAKVTIKQADSVPPQNYDQGKDTPLYVRPGDRQTISSTYNVDTRPQTYNGVGSEQALRPSYQQTTDQRQQNTGNIRPAQLPGENNGSKPSQTSWSAEECETWAEPPRNGMEIASGYAANDCRTQTVDGSGLTFDRLTTEAPVPAPNRIEEYDSSKPDEFYDGGLPVLYIPIKGPKTSTEPTCGRVLLNKDRGINLKSTDTLEGQWPWQIALYQQQTSVDFRYICGGTLVSKRHVITAAHCVTRKKSTRTVNKNTLTVYLGKHNLRNSVEGVQVKFVNKILLYPEYEATTFRTDLAILQLRDTVTFSDRIQPVCLWPEQETDIRNVVGKTGSIVGWGYEPTGVARTELTLLHMAVVDQETCAGSYADFFRLYTSDRTYCAGYRNYGTSCNGDSGGGMVFQKGDSWYLRGVVSLSVARQGTIGCDPNHYVIFTDVAKFLPWIRDNIEDYI